MTFDSYDRFPQRTRIGRPRSSSRAQARAEDARLYRLANPALCAFLDSEAQTNEFAGKMLAAITQWGGLTDGQKAAVERMMNRPAADPALVSYLESKAEGNEFAASLLSGLRRFGSLTPKQQAAVDRMRARDTEPSLPATAPAPVRTPVEFIGTAPISTPAEFVGEDPDEFYAEEVTGTEATDPSHPHLLTTAEQAVAFMLAGNAVVTFKSRATGTRFTYRLRTPRSGGDLRFVSLLSGNDNTNSYSYFGFVRNGEFIHGGQKAKVASSAQSVQVFAWVWSQIKAGTIPANLEIWHEGRCGRCGRRLTVPSSIASGIGPECAGRMGG